MKLRLILIASFLSSTAAFGQTPPAPPDVGMLNRALNVLQAQRNEALDKAAIMEAKAIGLAEDLAKANARLKEKEEKAPPEK